MKNITVLGSTGSIGTQTLEIVRSNPELRICAMAAGHNVLLAEKQIREFKPAVFAMFDENAAKELALAVQDMPVRILAGMDGLLEVAVYPESEIVVTSMVGMIGIRPTIAAIKAGKDIALANKETLVTAGHIIMPLTREYGVKILPVDSEHSAIFQSLQGEEHDKLSKILLTASGGPFRGKKTEELIGMKAADALKHPNWSMGNKITIDSATLVNKGLEVMEACWLFDVTLDQIQVIVQPQSIIHSMVEYTDGAIISQLGVPDMKLPIQYALFYPERKPMHNNRVDFYKLAQITFEEPDMETFYGLKLALKAAQIGGSMPTVFNAANEKAVELFLHNQIGFMDIPDTIQKVMEAHHIVDNPSVEEILLAEQEAYATIEQMIR